VRSNKSRFALLGVLALALGAFAGPGVANAAKVSQSAGPIAIPDATDAGAAAPDINGEGVLEFKFKGSKVKKKQTLDVNVILNATGGGNGALSDLFVTLIGPKGDNFTLPTPFGNAWVDLTFDSQSDLFACDPAVTINSSCNYISGGPNGTFTGSLAAGLNPTFKGVNPKGTWKLKISDGDDDLQPASTVSAEVELKTGKKFAKED
jgi:hypothetical protein